MGSQSFFPCKWPGSLTFPAPAEAQQAWLPMEVSCPALHTVHRAHSTEEELLLLPSKCKHSQDQLSQMTTQNVLRFFSPI